MPGGLNDWRQQQVTVARKDDENRKRVQRYRKSEVSVDVDALLAAINEISESKFIAARTILNTLASMDVNIIMA